MPRWRAALLVFLLTITMACSTITVELPFARSKKIRTAEEILSDMKKCEVWAKEQTNFVPIWAPLKESLRGSAVGAMGGSLDDLVDKNENGALMKRIVLRAATLGTSGAVIGASRGFLNSQNNFNLAYEACMSAHDYDIQKDVQK